MRSAPLRSPGSSTRSSSNSGGGDRGRTCKPACAGCLVSNEVGLPMPNPSKWRLTRR